MRRNTINARRIHPENHGLIAVGRRPFDTALDEVAEGGPDCPVDLEQQRIGSHFLLPNGVRAGQQQRDDCERQVPHGSEPVFGSSNQGTPDTLV